MLECSKLSTNLVIVFSKQHLEVMIWCVRHKFLENSDPRYSNLVSWKLHVRDRKLAASERTWPSSSMLESTLFIEDALSNLQIERVVSIGDELDIRTLTSDSLPLSESSEMVGMSGIYPFKDLHSATDILFLHGSSDMAVAKHAIVSFSTDLICLIFVIRFTSVNVLLNGL